MSVIQPEQFHTVSHSQAAKAMGMSAAPEVRRHAALEVQALLQRVDRLLPFSSTMTMVPAAGVSLRAMALIESQQRGARARLRRAASEFLRWLNSAAGAQATATRIQNRFVILKMRFNAVLSQFDIFADVLVQRSELGTGIWIAGLDDLAADALRLDGMQLAVPEMVCYLDRGHGAAIRRAKTELPGGDMNPVAIIRIPRERMAGLGIGASLVHEVGHQAAAILDLVPALTDKLREAKQGADPADGHAWNCWQHWISEIVADLWSVGQLGVTATYGLMGVVSLPRFFMFQVELDGPHPFPWIRVMLSITMGRMLYPDGQWDRVEGMWRAMYPLAGLTDDVMSVLSGLLRTMPRFLSIVLGHRPGNAGGSSLAAAFRLQNRGVDALRSIGAAMSRRGGRWHELRPTLAIAAIGQARIEARLTPTQESRLISRLLIDWAVRSSLTGSRSLAACSATTTGL
ncbi:MAG: hypothetical protein ACK56E_23825 [Planctomyces sp.]